MIKVDRSVDVARAPEVVFDYLADVRRFPQWQPAIERAEQLTDGPLVAGTRVRLVVRAPTGPTELLGEIVAADRPTLLAIRSIGGPLDVAIRCAIEPEATGSRIALTGTIELKGMLRFAEGVARGMIDRDMPAALADLARHIEAET